MQSKSLGSLCNRRFSTHFENRTVQRSPLHVCNQGFFVQGRSSTFSAMSTSLVQTGSPGTTREWQWGVLGATMTVPKWGARATIGARELSIPNRSITNKMCVANDA